MGKIHVTLPDELHQRLKIRAKKNNHFLQDEVIEILERGMDTIKIPVVGTVGEDGNIIITNYWDTPEEKDKK